jgi:ABC-type antimicrobial peptide transport system permease subunit
VIPARKVNKGLSRRESHHQLYNQSVGYIQPTPMFDDQQTIKYAMIGGLVSIPLVIGSNWIAGTESYFSANALVVGGFLAGYLAENNGANAPRAGVVAGVVGFLPGYVWALPQMVQTAGSWPSPIDTAVMLVIIPLSVVGIAALAGGIGALLGGWVTARRNDDSSPAANA